MWSLKIFGSLPFFFLLFLNYSLFADSHTTSNFTTDSNTLSFNLNSKAKEAGDIGGLNQSSSFFIDPINSPRSATNGTYTYRQTRANQLPSSTSLYSFKQPSKPATSVTSGNTQTRKPKTQLSSNDQSSKTSLNTLNYEADYAGKSGWCYCVVECCLN